MKDKQMMEGTIGGLSADKPLSDGTVISHYRLDPQWFEPFIEPSDIAKRLENIDKVDGFASEQQIAIKEFLQEYGLRQQGKDPDDVR